jgi:hypothetical protein
MNANSVKTVGDFAGFIRKLLDEVGYEDSLEEYLRALWGILSPKRETEPSWAFFAQCFQDAYTASIIEFDEAWMRYELPPALVDDIAGNDFGLVEEMLLSQIADLRRMRNAGTLDIEPHILWMGVISPTKQSWYNFSVHSYLECASRWMEDARNDFGESICTWFDLALFLEVGQIYE